MMLNKMPPDISIESVLDHLETKTKYGTRNRAMFVLRQRLRIRDISELLVSDVLGLDGKIRSCYISADGQVFHLDEHLKAELHRYLVNHFELNGNSLSSLLAVNLNFPLFPTQKRARFSNNTLAQHFSYLDKSIWQCFKSDKIIKKTSILQRLKSTFTSVQSERS
jgi:hypothetical protein